MYQQHMILKKEEEPFEINAYQVSCPLYSPLYNMSSCRSVLKYLSLYCKGALAIRRIFSLVDMITKP